MKKLVTAACALAAGLAMAEGVTSANTVGFIDITTVANTMDTAGVPFTGVAASGDISIQDIKLVGTVSYGEDWIKFWNPATKKYTFAYYWDELYADVEDDDPIPGAVGWGDGDQTLITMTLPAGRGFWAQTANSVKVSIPGEVVSVADNKIRTVANTMDLFANVYPVRTDIQDITLKGSVTYGEDWIKFWNPATKKYEFAYYWNELYADVEDDDPIPGKVGWGDGDQTLITKTLDIGEGFWSQTANAVDIEFKVPAGLE